MYDAVRTEITFQGRVVIRGEQSHNKDMRQYNQKFEVYEDQKNRVNFHFLKTIIRRKYFIFSYLQFQTAKLTKNR